MKDEIESKAFNVLLLRTVFITRNNIEPLCLSTNIDEVPVVILGSRVMATTLPMYKRKSKLHAQSLLLILATTSIETCVWYSNNLST